MSADQPESFIRLTPVASSCYTAPFFCRGFSKRDISKRDISYRGESFVARLPTNQRPPFDTPCHSLVLFSCYAARPLGSLKPFLRWSFYKRNRHKESFVAHRPTNQRPPFDTPLSLPVNCSLAVQYAS